MCITGERLEIRVLYTIRFSGLLQAIVKNKLCKPWR